MPNIEFFTGFEGCGNTADCRVMVDHMNYYDANVLMVYDASRGYDGGKCVRCSGSNYFWFQHIYQECIPKKTICTGWHVRGLRTAEYANSHPSNGFAFLFLVGGGELRFFNTSTGVQVYRNDTLIASCLTTIPGGAEIGGFAPIHHIEIKVISHDTTGYVGVKLDGISIIDESNVNTSGADIWKVRWSPNSNSTQNNTNCAWDNLFIADDWVGEMRSVMLKPTVDDSKQFTPDTGDYNFDRINDTAPDGDVSYVESNQVGHKDIYQFENLEEGLIPMVAKYVVNARKTDVGPRVLSMRAVQGATTHNLEERPLAIEYPNTHFAGLIDTLTRCPDGTVWDRDNLNAVKWGFEITE